MSSASVPKALQFVKSVKLPPPPRTRFAAVTAPVPVFDAAKDQAAVVGSEIMSFARGVSPEQRGDIANAALLAQLVAKRKLPEPKSLADVRAWYSEYFDVLAHVGFAIQDKGFAEYRERSDHFEAHQAILELATALLAGSPGAILLVKTTLEALQKMSKDSPWITLFNRESRSANTGRFQVSLVEQDASGGSFLSILAFGLEAKSALTQVLFFKFHTNEVKLGHHSGKVSVNSPLLASVRDQIATRLAKYTGEYIQGLPDL